MYIEGLAVEYATPTDLLDAADHVVEGRVVSHRSAYWDTALDPTAFEGDDPVSNPLAGDVTTTDHSPSQIVVTYYDLEVTRVLGGTVAEGQTVTVVELGGEIDGTSYRMRDVPPLREGTPYVLALTEDAQAGVYHVTSPTQGAFERESSGELSPTSPRNDIAEALEDALQARLSEN
ncbi:hypothetical protein N869_04675 [Cellulomonas bogoriensis 69B4 = DSM 16987]|uniref:Uncharacterized protein n=1 Tax=Cellulomonas bogoriensis 69B4 = DSM 16987 TaxID=1386082 RepID=A0A0A0C3Z3_9CELL|nr:hypothetical protein N869_04675 [Cellulomonas bogoriensis 69B4 = DSM 16987]